MFPYRSKTTVYQYTVRLYDINEPSHSNKNVYGISLKFTVSPMTWYCINELSCDCKKVSGISLKFTT